MPGEFTSGRVPTQDAEDAKRKVDLEPGKIETDVADVFADGLKDNIPVFEVPENDFYKNMKMNRKRIRFSPDLNVSDYMRKTKYAKPFWIKVKDGDYMRKIK